MRAKKFTKTIQLGTIILLPIVLLAVVSALMAGHAQAQEPETGPGFFQDDIPGLNNLIKNGNFEGDFYPVSELGFEPTDIGNIPVEWNWYRSDAYGKYTIDKNEGFGLICREDVDSPFAGARKGSLSFHMQSTDQPDARLGVYQTIEVVPGIDYLFSISGTIQVQKGGGSPDVNHRVQVYFDHTGNTDWRAVPQNQWINLPWPEQDLEFELTGPNDPDLAQVKDYFKVVRAESDKMTLFLTGWRRWPNWRTSIFTFDCVSLVPLEDVQVTEILPNFIEQSTTDLDQALEAAAVTQSGEPVDAESAVATEAEPDTAPAPETVIIPPSGGVLEADGNSVLLAVSSLVIILGLVGAGVWNIRRQRQ